MFNNPLEIRAILSRLRNSEKNISNMSGKVSVLEISNANMIQNSSGYFNKNYGWTDSSNGLIKQIDSLSGDGPHWIAGLLTNNNSNIITVADQYLYLSSDKILISGSTQFVLSSEMSLSGVGTISTECKFYDSSNNLLDSMFIKCNSAEWTRKIISKISPANTSYCKIYIIIYPNSDISKVGWKRIKLEKGDAGSQYSSEGDIRLLSQILEPIANDIVSVVAPNKILKLDVNGKLPASITGDAAGNAGTATKLQTARKISLSGDASGLVNFDGSIDTTLALTLANSGVTVGTYTKVTVDAKGRVTSGSSMVASDIPNLDWSKITSGKPTTLGGYGITDAVNTSDVVAIATANKILKLDANGKLPASITGDAAGNAATATKLQTARTISLSTDASGSVSFDGSVNATLALTLANSGVVTGTYTKVTVDAKGRVTSGSSMIASDIPNLDWSKITSGKPTTLGGYGITDAINTSDVVVVSTANKILKLDANGKLPASITGDADGNAATATKLQTTRTISLSGDASGSGTFDGSTNASLTLTLANSGVVTGTYTKVTVDAKGRVTNGSSMVASDIPNLDWSKITSGKPTTLGGYGITDAVNTSDVVAIATANKILKLDANGKLPASITGDAAGNSGTASKLQTARTISLSGDVSGSGTFDGGANLSIITAVADDSHNHSNYTPFETKNAATAATAGWYRIAQSRVNIIANSGLFKIDFSGTGIRGRVLFIASCHDGSTVGSGINQLGFTTTNVTLGLTKVRIVYHTTATGNYAYVELYNPTALAITYTVDLIDSTGWSLITPSTVGSIPSGYVSEELTLDTGIVSAEDITATRQLVSKVASGTPPLIVSSPTVIPNLNSCMVDGKHVDDLVLKNGANTMTGILKNDIHSTTACSYRGNWVVSNYWGFGPTDIGNNLKFGVTDINGNWVAGDLQLILGSSNKVVATTDQIPTLLSQLSQDANNRLVTDAEKSTWNDKASVSVATASANGLMSSADKSKLDGIAAGANAYVHPSAHPASIITQDASNRFVTDAEKSTWNAKASVSVATASANGLMSSADKSKLDGLNANNYLQLSATANTAGKFDTTTTAPTNTNRLNYSGYFYATRTYNAVYCDYAEYYERDLEDTDVVEPGDVVIVKDNGLYGKSISDSQQTVIGVCSDSYGHIVGGTGDKEKDDKNYIAIGLAGRVHVKVIGKVRRGYLLTTSLLAGVARAIQPGQTYIPGTVIGKALENHDSNDHVDKIRMQIMNI